jgi:hypothetical protein
LEYLASSSSVYLHVISLILLWRIRLTRRWEYSGLSQGASQDQHNDGGYASLILEASQDWHKAMESMPDEENVLEGVNLGHKGAKSAWEGEIRPGE